MFFAVFINCEGFSALKRYTLITWLFVRTVCLQFLKVVLKAIIIYIFFAPDTAFEIWMRARLLLHAFFLFLISHTLQTFHIGRMNTFVFCGWTIFALIFLLNLYLLGKTINAPAFIPVITLFCSEHR